MAISGSGGGGGSGAVRAGAAFVEVFAKNGALIRTLDDSKRRLGAFSAAAMKVGAAAFAGGAGITGAIGAGAVSALSDLSDQSATIKAFGLTAEAGTRLFGIMKSGGSDLRDATEGLVTLGQRVDEALAGKGEVAADLFKQLGVGAERFKGLNPAEQFDLMMESLRGVADPAARVNLLMKAFGEDTGKNLLKLLARTPAELKRMGDAFQMSAADLAAADAATAAYSGAIAGIGQAWDRAAVAVAPLVEQVAGHANTAAGAMSVFARENQGAVQSVAVGATALAVGGAALFGLGLAGSAAAAGLGLVASGVAFATGPVGILTLGLGAAGVALVQAHHQMGAFDGILARLGTDAATFGGTFKTTWAGVQAALKGGDLKLAGQVGMAGLSAAWQTTCDLMGDGWRGFTRLMVDSFAAAVTEVKKLGNTMSSEMARDTFSMMARLRENDPTGGRVFDMFMKTTAKGLVGGAPGLRLFGITPGFVDDLATGARQPDEARKQVTAAERGRVGELDKDAVAEQQKRDAKRREEDDKLARDRKAAADKLNKELADLSARSRLSALVASFAKVSAAGGVGKPSADAAQATVGVASRGAFGQNIAQQLGVGSIQDRGVKATEKAAQGIDRVNDNLIRVIEAIRNSRPVFS